MDITQIILALIALVGTIITTVLVPYIQSKTSKEKLQKLSLVVQTGVEAAEQIFVGTGLGQQKKDWVIQYLKEKGYKVDVDAVSVEINALIEAAVYAINSSNK